ncbi:MAG: anaerobic carbon-monoxide dehydrogenase catalytic subunit [Thermincola sp.]|jgi:carbon-monoxide dehydrogenase catalytic subunit|nr:anaerobic carbon-monoxide dehydrogenase catalytic subunit [Thermincola sp.]MDT3703054.1 anaerobic carbon-monoxide dehydrogenase catalytic subunit [Thermincola sp.]
MGKRSYHQSVEEMLTRTEELGIPTTYSLYEAQQPQCKFGQDGVCCQLCSHGPCRITGKADRGICGITADGIVARNMLRLASHGVSAYSFQMEQAINTLRSAGLGQTSFKIKDQLKLKIVCSGMGLDTDCTTEQQAINLADFMTRELSKSENEPLIWVEKFFPMPRQQLWHKLNIFPGGVHSEIRNAMTRAMTSIDTDPRDLIMQSLRLSIANAFCMEAATTIQDIVLGSPTLTRTKADFGVLTSETVNIVAHGHIPWMANAVLNVLRTGEFDQEAKAAGAQGIKLYGSMDTGQELLQRLGDDTSYFGGQLGNWLTQELWMATGAADLVMVDYNCTIPTLQLVAEQFHTQIVPVSKVVRLTGSAAPVDYVPAEAQEQARTLIKQAIDAYKNRKQTIQIPQYTADVVSGFGAETVLGLYGYDLTVFIDKIRNGQIKGVAAVVGCTNNKNGHDTITVELTKELIKRNILVLSGGCSSSAMQAAGLMSMDALDQAGASLAEECRSIGVPPVWNFGACTDIGRMSMVVTVLAGMLDVDTPKLPVAVSAPEYLEQKAVADGFFALAFGLWINLGPLPPITGGAEVSKVLQEEMVSITGGQLDLTQGVMEVADAMEAAILAKREAMGWK